MQLTSKVWSNSFFLIPLLQALWFEFYWHSLLIFFVMIFSTLYHLSDQQKFAIFDKLFAYALIMYNLYVSYLSHFTQPYFLLALLFVGIGFYFFFFKKKDDYEWHLSCATITIFCIFGYGFSV